MNGEVDPPFRPQHPIPDPNDFPTSPGRVGARSCCHGRTARPECVLPRSFQGRHGPQSVSGAYAADPSVPSSADRFRLRHNLHGLHPDIEHPTSHSQADQSRRERVSVRCCVRGCDRSCDRSFVPKSVRRCVRRFEPHGEPHAEPHAETARRTSCDSPCVRAAVQRCVRRCCRHCVQKRVRRDFPTGKSVKSQKNPVSV